MTDDALSSFVEAYRAEHSGRSLDRRGLRERIVASAGRRRVRRAERLRLLLPFAASFVGSLAFAASPPVRERVREAFSFVRSGESARATPRPSRPPQGKARTALSPAPRAAEPPPVAPPPAFATSSPEALEATPVAVAPITVAPARATRSVAPPFAGPVAPVRPSVAGSQSAPAAAPPSSASFDVEPEAPAALAKPVAAKTPVASSADLALYRRAHELHFGGADRGRALAAWDAYLRAFPHGTFAPEARLNRAVCLAKLGRKAEAEGVLLDIERGRFGKDGQRQARKILGALED